MADRSSSSASKDGATTASKTKAGNGKATSAITAANGPQAKTSVRNLESPARPARLLDAIPEDIRAELRRIQGQHNLSSVMHGAAFADNEDLGWFGSLGALMFEGRDTFESTAPMPSVIAPVELEDFQEYLAKSRAALHIFLRNHDVTPLSKVNAAARRIRLRERLSVDETSASSPSGSVKRTLQLAKGLAALQQQQQQQQRRELASGGSDGKQALEACFRLVPSKFFESKMDVSLEDGDNDSYAAYLMHEKLSGWLDQVEVCLWSQTTSQAHEFFAALSDLSSLSSQVAGACQEIAALRRHIQDARRNVAESNLAVLHHKRRRQNVTRLETLMSQIREVRSCIPTVEKLTQLHDYSGALALLANARRVLRTDLRKVHSLQTLQRQMTDFEDMIVDQLKTRFVEVAVNFEVDDEREDGTELEEDAAVMQLKEQLMPIVVGLFTAYQSQLEAANDKKHKPNTKDKGIEAMEGKSGANQFENKNASKQGHHGSNGSDASAQSSKTLIGINPIMGALESYREAAIAEVRSSVENGVAIALAEVQAESEDAGRGEAAPVTVNRKQLIEMSHASFLTFIGLVFESLTVVMARAARLDKALRKCIQEQGIESENVVESSGRILAKVSELSQSSVGKLYTLRMNSCIDQVSLVEFKQLYEKVGAFTVQAERLTGLRRGGSLLESLRAQARRFLTTTHKHAMDNLRESLNKDLWKAVEVPRSVQGTVRRLLSGNPRMDRPPINVNGVLEVGRGTKASASVSGSRGAGALNLNINGQPHKAVSSSLSLLHALESYMSCAQQLSLSHDTLGLTVEILRLYNERSNRLVLHLEACSEKTAGLSGITTKNLGMASQALSIVISLVPCLRAILASSLPSRSRHLERDKRDIQLQLEQVSSEFERHRKRIFDKIVELLTSLLNDCCSAQSLSSVNWDHAQMEQPEPYMLKLTKGVRSVHRVVSKILPPEQLQEVFEMVFQVFNKRVPELYAGVQPKTGVGNVKVYIDLNHLSRCLHMLPGTHGLGDELDVFINQHFPPTASQSRTREQVASAAAVASAKAENAAKADEDSGNTGVVEVPKMVPDESQGLGNEAGSGAASANSTFPLVDAENKEISRVETTTPTEIETINIGETEERSEEAENETEAVAGAEVDMEDPYPNGTQEVSESDALETVNDKKEVKTESEEPPLAADEPIESLPDNNAADEATAVQSNSLGDAEQDNALVSHDQDKNLNNEEDGILEDQEQKEPFNTKIEVAHGEEEDRFENHVEEPNHVEDFQNDHADQANSGPFLETDPMYDLPGETDSHEEDESDEAPADLIRLDDDDALIEAEDNAMAIATSLDVLDAPLDVGDAFGNTEYHEGNSSYPEEGKEDHDQDQDHVETRNSLGFGEDSELEHPVGDGITSEGNFQDAKLHENDSECDVESSFFDKAESYPIGNGVEEIMTKTAKPEFAEGNMAD